MPGKVAGLGERLATRRTEMRLLSRMCQYVNGQAEGPRERLVTFLALMRFLIFHRFRRIWRVTFHRV